MQTSELFKQKKLSFSKINRNLIVMILFVLFSYFLLQMIVTSVVGTKSEEIYNVRQEKANLRLENVIYTAKIDQLKSITATKDYQTKMQLVNKNVSFLDEKVSNNIALNK